MKILTKVFRREALRYALLPDNGILFNTSDSCRILRIKERSPGGILDKSCLNVAGVIEATHAMDRNYGSFVEWIEAEFFGYDVLTLVDLNCDNDR